ncbi:hypothetical protein ABH926_009373 [Catenulispora sp. GP43]|uniref:hypothetical protein n=1 Tax=Catenulispora sp. GP43 TaxID=3156263 RepID=UPI0035148040
MSALYPAPSPAAAAWLATLRTALASLADQVRVVPPIDVDAVAFHLESESPEAAELGEELRATLDEFEPIIGGLTAAFAMWPSTILIALGRGEEIGELDPVVAAASRAEIPDIRALTSSGTVTIGKDGRSTTLIAATTVGTPVGPVRIRWPDRDDVWLCAVPAAADPALTTRAALERILPHVGVSRARLRTAPESRPAAPHSALHAALLTIDPTADPDLVMARLEGWRTALEQLHRGAVAVYWEQA